MKIKIKTWFESKGIVSLSWILISIFVFEILFLTTPLDRRSIYFTYLLITFSVPIALYVIYFLKIYKKRIKNQKKLIGYYEVIASDYKTKDLKKKFLEPLSKLITINKVKIDNQEKVISILAGTVEKLCIQFERERAVIRIDETPVQRSFYYRRMKKIDDWNCSCNHRIHGTNVLYQHMISFLETLIIFGCLIEEYNYDSKEERIIAYLNNVEKVKFFDSLNPFTQKKKVTLFKAKPKSYKIIFK